MAKGKKTGGRNFPKGNQYAKTNKVPMSEEEKKLREVIRKGNLTETLQAFANIIDMTESELKTLYQNGEARFSERIMAHALRDDFRKAKLTNLMMILERVYGKASLHIKVEGDIEITHKTIFDWIHEDDDKENAIIVEKE